jgi:hypothetical protein
VTEFQNKKKMLPAKQIFVLLLIGPAVESFIQNSIKNFHWFFLSYHGSRLGDGLRERTGKACLG